MAEIITIIDAPSYCLEDLTQESIRIEYSGLQPQFEYEIRYSWVGTNPNAHFSNLTSTPYLIPGNLNGITDYNFTVNNPNNIPLIYTFTSILFCLTTNQQISQDSVEIKLCPLVSFITYRLALGYDPFGNCEPLGGIVEVKAYCNEMNPALTYTLEFMFSSTQYITLTSPLTYTLTSIQDKIIPFLFINNNTTNAIQSVTLTVHLHCSNGEVIEEIVTILLCPKVIFDSPNLIVEYTPECIPFNGTKDITIKLVGLNPTKRYQLLYTCNNSTLVSFIPLNPFPQQKNVTTYSEILRVKSLHNNKAATSVIVTFILKEEDVNIKTKGIIVDLCGTNEIVPPHPHKPYINKLYVLDLERKFWTKYIVFNNDVVEDKPRFRYLEDSTAIIAHDKIQDLEYVTYPQSDGKHTYFIFESIFNEIALLKTIKSVNLDCETTTKNSIKVFSKEPNSSVPLELNKLNSKDTRHYLPLLQRKPKELSTIMIKGNFNLKNLEIDLDTSTRI